MSDMATAVETSSKSDATLPEPAEHSAQADAAVSADDLIAQLADTEIEKMIAATEDLKQTVDEAIAPAEPEPVEALAPEPVEAPAPELVEPVSDAIVAEAPAELESEAPMPLEATDEVVVPLPDETSSLESAAADVARELEADAAIESARTTVSHAAKPHARVSAGAIASTGAMAVARVVNRPVRGMSDSTRELVGSIAIITLVNAMAILLYVMIFR